MTGIWLNSIEDSSEYYYTGWYEYLLALGGGGCCGALRCAKYIITDPREWEEGDNNSRYFMCLCIGEF